MSRRAWCGGAGCGGCVRLCAVGMQKLRVFGVGRAFPERQACASFAVAAHPCICSPNEQAQAQDEDDEDDEDGLSCQPLALLQPPSLSVLLALCTGQHRTRPSTSTALPPAVISPTHRMSPQSAIRSSFPIQAAKHCANSAASRHKQIPVHGVHLRQSRMSTSSSP